jgi:hypothetical protein
MAAGIVRMENKLNLKKSRAGRCATDQLIAAMKFKVTTL